MFTPRDIRDMGFDTTSRGYKIEDVDGFLARVADQMEGIMAEKADAEQKLVLLAERVEQYRQEEDALRSALISAERMKENILAEATQQQEILVRDAQQKAERIVNEAESKIEREEVTLSALKQQVASFKSEVLNIYKSHLEILSDLPDEPGDMNFENMSVDDVVPPRAAEPAPAPMPVPMPEPVPQPQAVEEPASPAPAAADSYDGFAPRMEDFSIAVASAAEETLASTETPNSQDSVFASFAAEEAPAAPSTQGEDASRFGNLDFGESFSFGRD